MIPIQKPSAKTVLKQDRAWDQTQWQLEDFHLEYSQPTRNQGIAPGPAMRS